LKIEIVSSRQKLPESTVISTVYFGGGTPSLLSPEAIAALLDIIAKHYPLSAQTEITLESNPGTLKEDKITAVKAAGINRLSIGIQSFHDDDLQFLTRIHNSDEAEKAVYRAADAGFRNINIDLIFNLPHETQQKWMYNLRKAASLPITHISAYSLIVEDNTPLKRMVESGAAALGDDSFDAELYLQTIHFLEESGFHQYEVSNFAKEGFQCRHNQIYWYGGEYLGFGPSAHSFAGNTRSWNYRDVGRYTKALIEKGDATEDREVLTPQQQQDEYIMLAMRSQGVNYQEYEKRFGNASLKSFQNKCSRFRDHGHFVYLEEGIRFTPKGYTLADTIIAVLVS
jgi:oxygen-independent coproporphyrinogen-3 oxidase